MNATTERYAVQRVRIAGTNYHVFSAWEPSSHFGKHYSITTIDGQIYGRVGTERLPDELEKLPAFSQERGEQVIAWRQEQYQRSYQMIRTAFDIDIDNTCESMIGKPREDMGEIGAYFAEPLSTLTIHVQDTR
jgi:hypothetical protein